MKYLSFLIMAGVFMSFLLPLCSALTYQEDVPIDIKVPCTLDGFPCSSSAVCNISIQYPNSSYLVDNQVMTNGNNGDFNYTTTFTEIGDYPTKVPCTDNNQNATSTFDIVITQTGSELSTGQGIIYIVFFIALIFVFVLCLYGAIRIPWKHSRADDGRIVGVNEYKYAKVFLWVLSYLIMLFILGIARQITSNYLFLTGASNVFTWLYWTMFYFLFPGMIISIIVLVVTFLRNLEIKEAILRNIPLR